MARNFCTYENVNDNNKLYPVTDLNYQPLLCAGSGKCFKFNFSDIAKNPANYSGETSGDYIGYVDAMKMKIMEPTTMDCNTANGKVASIDKSMYMISNKNPTVDQYMTSAQSIIEAEKWDSKNSASMFKINTTNISQKYSNIQDLFRQVVVLAKQANIASSAPVIAAPPPKPVPDARAIIPVNQQKT